jgi:hypothetical protein
MAHESHHTIRKQESVDSPIRIEKSRHRWFMPCRLSSFVLAVAHG